MPRHGLSLLLIAVCAASPLHALTADKALPAGKCWSVAYAAKDREGASGARLTGIRLARDAAAPSTPGEVAARIAFGFEDAPGATELRVDCHGGSDDLPAGLVCEAAAGGAFYLRPSRGGLDLYILGQQVDVDAARAPGGRVVKQRGGPKHGRPFTLRADKACG